MPLLLLQRHANNRISLGRSYYGGQRYYGLEWTEKSSCWFFLLSFLLLLVPRSLTHSLTFQRRGKEHTDRQMETADGEQQRSRSELVRVGSDKYAFAAVVEFWACAIRYVCFSLSLAWDWFWRAKLNCLLLRVMLVWGASNSYRKSRRKLTCIKKKSDSVSYSWLCFFSWIFRVSRLWRWIM